MATSGEVVSYAASKLNQKVTVPYNPYGGQCAAYVDAVSTYLTGKNLAYTNAIDLLKLARAKGFPVTYFTGSEIPPVGAIWVSAASNHNFGHTGFFETVDANGDHVVTLEQNVDLNADALYNGGWVRRKQRTIYQNGTFTYDNDPNGLPAQRIIGWFTIAEKQSKKIEEIIKEKEEEDTMLLITNKEKQMPMLLLTGGKICGIPEDRGNVKAFTRAGAESIAVTDKMYTYLKHTYK